MATARATPIDPAAAVAVYLRFSQLNEKSLRCDANAHIRRRRRDIKGDGGTAPD
jgi:hypothetical protein